MKKHFSVYELSILHKWQTNIPDIVTLTFLTYYSQKFQAWKRMNGWRKRYPLILELLLKSNDRWHPRPRKAGNFIAVCNKFRELASLPIIQ